MKKKLDTLATLIKKYCYVTNQLKVINDVQITSVKHELLIYFDVVFCLGLNL